MDARWYRQLGARVARLRHQAKRSQEQLAEAADIAPSYLARIETGARRPTLDVLARIAEALKQPLNRLIIDERATRAAEGQELWGRPARLLSQLLPELAEADVELLLRFAQRLRRA